MSPSFTRRAAFVLSLVPAVAFAQPARNRQPAATPPAAAAGAAELKTFEQKLSYAVGVNVARNLQQQGLNPDPQIFLSGFRDQLEGGELLLSEDQLNEVFAQVQEQLREQAEAAMKKAEEEFTAAFSDANKPKEEPKTTKSGLKYEVFKQGDGPKPKPTDVVVAHYVGKLPDGKVFDSSLARGEPLALPLSGGIIQGWKEALPLMSVGSRYRLFIPAALAYGEEGRPPVIKPNQDLIFDIELLDIDSPQGEAAEGEAPAAPEGDAPAAPPE